MDWWKRLQGGISTPTNQKKETPEGLWYNCPKCKETVTSEEHNANLWVCIGCGHHDRINSEQYFSILFDDQKYKELNADIVASDPLGFQDVKKYTDRLAQAKNKTGLKDAIRTAHGKMNGHKLVVACMDFSFIGGSMGSVVGEKISRAIDFAIKSKTPLLIISKSGGARMMEAAFSLMQMAKISAKLSLLSSKKIPYISLLTDPTTGGVTASFAMQGDLNVAEPDALIAFAGPRVVKETIGKDLPEGFQRSEFVLEHGFLDAIIQRKNLKEQLTLLIKYFIN